MVKESVLLMSVVACSLTPSVGVKAMDEREVQERGGRQLKLDRWFVVESPWETQAREDRRAVAQKKEEARKAQERRDSWNRWQFLLKHN